MSELRALVLGGSGFIGGHLLSALSRHPAFASMQSIGDGEVAGGFPHLRGEIDERLLAACAPPDVVYWLAGSASVAQSIADPQGDFERSLPPLDALLHRLAGAWQAAHLVFVSSAAVYGSAAGAATATSTRLAPISPYGEHKRLSEQRIGAQPGLSYSVLRPFSVYGPGLRKQLFWDAARKATHGEFDFFGSGEELRDWVYVDDLARLLADVGAAPREFPRLSNVGTGYGLSTREVLTQLFRAMQIPQLPRFAQKPRPGDPDRLVADATEQQAQAPWHRTSLEAGLEAYVRWLREVGAA